MTDNVTASLYLIQNLDFIFWIWSGYDGKSHTASAKRWNNAGLMLVVQQTQHLNIIRATSDPCIYGTVSGWRFWIWWRIRDALASRPDLSSEQTGYDYQAAGERDTKLVLGTHVGLMLGHCHGHWATSVPPFGQFCSLVCFFAWSIRIVTGVKVGRGQWHVSTE